MSYDLTGTVKIINDTQTFGSGFQKREFVVTVEDGKYPQDISLECLKDNCDKLENVAVGDTVTAAFDIRGKEYNGRYFNNLVCWKINVGSEAGNAPPAAATPDTADIDSEVPF